MGHTIYTEVSLDLEEVLSDVIARHVVECFDHNDLLEHIDAYTAACYYERDLAGYVDVDHVIMEQGVDEILQYIDDRDAAEFYGPDLLESFDSEVLVDAANERSPVIDDLFANDPDACLDQVDRLISRLSAEQLKEVARSVTWRANVIRERRYQERLHAEASKQNPTLGMEGA